MRLFVCFCLAALSLFGGTDTSAASVISKIPLRFEKDSDRLWTAHGMGFAVSIDRDLAMVHLGKEAFSVRFEGSNPVAKFAGEKKAAAPNVYFTKGNEHSADVYMQLRRTNIYAGIDVVYYGEGQSLEYDFQLDPGADASQIHMRFDGAQSTRLSENGSVVLTLRNGEITQKPPVTYQRKESGEIVSVASRYVSEDDGTYSLKLYDYDERRPLVVDPQVLFTGYLQGTGADTPVSISLDKNGAIYVVGSSLSTDFPTACCVPTGAVPSTNALAFITKMDPLHVSGDYILYSGFFGSTFGEFPRAAVADADGVFYLTGIVDDKSFPTTPNAYTQDNGDTRKMFLSAIDTNILGSPGLVYSTFFGGALTNALSEGEEPTAIALGPAKGQVYIAGFSSATDYPVKNAIQGTLKGQLDGFIASFDITKSGADSLLASTYLGGSFYDVPKSIAVDASGKAYVTGYTYSYDYPVSGDANQASYSGSSDIFLTRVNLSAATLEYSTFLGGSGIDQAFKVLLDANGRVGLTGFTQSTNFPITPRAIQSVPGGDGDAFLTILDLRKTPGNVIDYSTFYGGSGSDFAYDMRVGSTGNYYLGGYTLSRNLRAVDAFVPVSAQGSTDGFVAIINPLLAGGSGLVYSSYVTSSGKAIVQGIEVDSAGNTYVVGQALENAFPPGYAQQLPDSSTNVFVLIFRPSAVPAVRQQSTVLTKHPRSRQ